jgi:hypothetical protein
MGVIVNSPVIICTAFVDMANRLDFAEPCWVRVLYTVLCGTSLPLTLSLIRSSFLDLHTDSKLISPAL